MTLSESWRVQTTRRGLSVRRTLTSNRNGRDLNSSQMKLTMRWGSVVTGTGRAVFRTLRSWLQFSSHPDVLANFRSRVMLQDYVEIKPSVLISNWADLATISFEDSVERDCVSLVVGALASSGYIYVPEKVLLNRYPGPHALLNSEPNWLGRFFDYS